MVLNFFFVCLEILNPSFNHNGVNGFFNRNFLSQQRVQPSLHFLLIFTTKNLDAKGDKIERGLGQDNALTTVVAFLLLPSVGLVVTLNVIPLYLCALYSSNVHLYSGTLSRCFSPGFLNVYKTPPFMTTQILDHCAFKPKFKSR